MGAQAAVLRGRFAPSPSGRMHAGNLFSSLIAWLVAKGTGGSIVLRIEDLDPDRSKPAYADQIMRDYERFGLTWDEGPYFQSDGESRGSRPSSAYRAAFDALAASGSVYRCFCTRADLRAASAPHAGESFVYPETCRRLGPAEIERRIECGMPFAWRLRTEHRRLTVRDAVQGERGYDVRADCGDFVIRRADRTFAYQLAVVVDDAAQGVNSVVRGCDLLASTPQQMYLQELLGLPAVSYAHVPLFVDETGRRLSKRNRDAEADALLQSLGSPQAVLGKIAWVAGLIPACEPVTPDDLLRILEPEAVLACLRGRTRVVWPSL